jgi:(4S)-4-hydroxy-5-phosphonooxypentane-2,3-dione isomerase
MMIHVHVTIQVVPGQEAAFIEASAENARLSRQELGMVQFDLLRSAVDTSRFLLVEVYRDEGAVLAHKETAHYVDWRDKVAPLMAASRTSSKWQSEDVQGTVAELV